MGTDNKMGQIIQFPGGHRDSKNKDEKNTPAQTPPALPPNPPKSKAKKTAVITSLVLILGVSYFANRQMQTSGEASLSSSAMSGRGLASVGDNRPLTRDISSEKELVRQLGASGQRAIASLGANPTTEEKLRFEILDSRYRFEFNAGQITSIEFTPQWDDGSAPRYVNDRMDFLEKAKPLLPEFTDAEARAKEVLTDSIHESYVLMANGTAVGEVEFQLDLAGRLRSMKVQGAVSN